MLSGSQQPQLSSYRKCIAFIESIDWLSVQSVKIYLLTGEQITKADVVVVCLSVLCLYDVTKMSAKPHYLSNQTSYKADFGIKTTSWT